MRDQDYVSNVMNVLKVAKAGSYRGAMRSSGLGFRRLQQDIHNLEEKLGLLIFHKTTDGVVPTSEGKAIIEYAEQIETTMSGIMRLGKSLNKQQDGDVMLATTEGLGTFWISPRLSDFQNLHENISIRLHPSMTLADMRRFDVDLALQVVEPIMPDIKRIKLATLHLILAASESYIERYGMPQTPSELAKHKFVFHTSPQSSDRLIIEKATGQRLEQNQFVVLRNSSAHYMTIERGEGIGFMPTYGFVIGASTVPIQPYVNYALDVWLCFHSDSRSIPRVSKVIDWLTSTFDPRLYPWFRRDFVPPSKFDALLEQNGTRELVKRFGFSR
jgi:DNA-binding transcriptional LysR family regulator